MRKASLQVLAISAVLIGLSSIPSQAQWSKIGYHLYDPTGTGVITYRNGFLWVADGDLFLSADSGRTWTKFPFPDPAFNGIIYDLNFFDAQTGVAAFPGGTYLTNDQGRTWSLLKAGSPLSACFGLTKDIIAVAELPSQGVSVSEDHGQTWRTSLPGFVWQKIRGLRNGSFYAFGGLPDKSKSGGHLYTTTDYGLSWLKRAGVAAYDCWDFDVDSCDFSHVYLGNSDFFAPIDSQSRIYVSSDTGATWPAPIAFLAPFFSGSVALSTNAVYAGTRASGIYRSRDKGATWKPNGGPNNDPDTRLLACISDNIVIAGDDFGNVWRTINSGGDSITSSRVGSYSFVPDSLAQFDTLSSCGLAGIDTIRLITHCAPSAIASMNIVGPDSLNFFLAKRKNQDSIIVLFSAGAKSKDSATLQLHLADGSTESLLLRGFARQPPQLRVTAHNVSTDTIGATLYIPIIVKGGVAQSDLSFAIGYDTTTLVYVGAYAKNGGGLDASINRKAGSASVLFASKTIDWGDSIVGYLAFSIYPGKDSCALVVMDSFSISTQALLCQQSVDSVVTRVCAKAGCGAATFSNFLRYGRMPVLTLSPNPVRSTFSIRSEADLGLIHLELHDERGVLIESRDEILSAQKPLSIDASNLASGKYLILVKTPSYSQTLEMIRLR